MFASKFCQQPWRMLGAATAVLLLGAGLTNAAPPGGTGGGTIYFENSYAVATMNSDGSAKKPLPIPYGEPSLALHGNRRWFLETREIAGIYPNGNFMISHSLLTQTVTPNRESQAQQDRESLRVLEAWLVEPRFEKIKPQLQTLRTRLLSFVGPPVRP